MNISEMTAVMRQSSSISNQQQMPKLANGSLPPKGHVNPYCPEGMDITGRTNHRKIVPVDEEVAAKVKSLVFKSMAERGGMSDGTNDTGDIINEYVMTLAPEKRASAAWTLSQIHLEEADRLGEYVHQRDPLWDWGKPVKPGILDGYYSGIDTVI